MVQVSALEGVRQAGEYVPVMFEWKYFGDIWMGEWRDPLINLFGPLQLSTSFLLSHLGVMFVEPEAVKVNLMWMLSLWVKLGISRYPRPCLVLSCSLVAAHPALSQRHSRFVFADLNRSSKAVILLDPIDMASIVKSPTRQIRQQICCPVSYAEACDSQR